MNAARASVLRLLVASLTVTLAALLWGGAVRAQDPPPKGSSVALPSSAPSSSAPPSSTPAAETSDARKDIQRLRQTSAHIRDLLDEKLDLAVDPASLFDVGLADRAAIRVEIERLQAIVAHAKQGAAADAKQSVAADAGAAVATLEGGSEPPRDPRDYAALRDLDPDLWEARVALDEARLSFYALEPARQASVLARHDERKAEDVATKDVIELSEAEKKAQAAEADRLRALEAAKRARTEATRLVAEEHARLLGVAQRQAQFEVELVKREQAVDAQREATLALRRRVREVIEGGAVGPAATIVADSLYDELRRTLRESRDGLDASIAALASGENETPEAGEDRLAALPEDIDRAEVDATKREVESAAGALRAREERLGAERAKVLHDQVVSIDDDRRALLPHLSPAKLSAVTGFGPTGLDQALAEARHVALVLRYDFIAARRWLVSLSAPEAEYGRSAWAAAILALKWTVPIVIFVWWRRNAVATLDSLRKRLIEEEKKARRRVGPSWAQRALDFATRIRSPLEWLLLVVAVVWLLPPEGKALLEVQLASTVFYWAAGGALVVQTVDFLADAEGMRRRRHSKLVTEHLRLRSLRLLGRIVVVFGLILAISARMVGHGTIYGWVFRVCWFAAIPAVLVVVRWWRPVIFERVAHRRASPLTTWIAANQTGWRSLVAALVGGGLLLGTGVYRAVRGRISTFNVSRRVLAYLFQRGMTKKADRHSDVVHAPIDRKLYQALGPGVRSQEIVASEADDQVAQVIARINATGGGVFAIVGERGSGKTTLLRRIVQQTKNVSLVRCPFGGMEAFAPAFLDAMDADKTATLEDVAAVMEAEGEDPAVLIDNAHRLILPMIGGLKGFDRILAIARRHSQRVTWVFAFDDVIWRFFEQMRGSRPLFDEVIRLEPWSEEAIVSLITSRSKAASIDPTFSYLVPDLPPDADEIERTEAHEGTEASYYRLIWDSAAGNPGVALQLWRTSLGVRPDGEMAVKLFQAPDIRELETLPDPAVFALRTIIQLERARPEDIVRCAGVPSASVEDALRYGLGRGYFRESEGRYEVSWVWFRAITRFLQRRYLLFVKH